jgi:iron complex transport system substrate-binding protein
VRLIARAVGAEAQGDKLVGQVEQDFKDLADSARRIKQPAKAMFVLGVQNGRANVAGQATAANAILELAGAKNVATGMSGYRPVTDEAIVEMAPDVIPIMRRSSGNDKSRHRPTAGVEGRAVHSGRCRQTGYHDGCAVSPGLRATRTAGRP